MTNKDQSKYPYDRSEYVVMPPIRKAEDGTLTTEPQKVEVVDVDKLANFIRITNGENKMGAGQLAEKICEYLTLSHHKPEPPPIDVEALKRELAPILWRDWDDLIDKERNSITAIVDHLTATGRLKV